MLFTKGFKTDDKIKICNEYLIPDISVHLRLVKKKSYFQDEIIKTIIEKILMGKKELEI